MKKSLILMFMLSLLGHIAAAGMLYVAGAYDVWDHTPHNGTDDQKGDAVRVLWGFAEEIPMSRGLTKDDENTLPSSRLTKDHENVIPAQTGIQNAGSGLDSHLRGNDGQLAEDGRPVAYHEWRADDAQKSVAPAEPLSHPKPEADNAGLYGYHPDLSEETDTRSAGLYDRHSGAEADGVVQEEGNAQPSEGNPDSSAPSMASMGPAGECSSSAACMGTNVTASGVYPDIYKAGNSGKGNRGAGLKTFLEALRVEIERHKNYPPFARKNGIEGTAYLNFHIGDNGRPDGIIIERSSGSKILDESAIRTLKGMERFYPVPEEIRELEITVPIAYRLVEDAEKINR